MSIDAARYTIHASIIIDPVPSRSIEKKLIKMVVKTLKNLPLNDLPLKTKATVKVSSCDVKEEF